MTERRPREWRVDDIERLRAERIPESLTLDYKSSADLQRAHKEQICKDISALANADGGTIVYGAVEDEANCIARLDGGVDISQIDPEWIGNILDGNVHPRLERYVKAVPATSGRVYYVVEVPKGLTAYMAPDHRYYRRYDQRSVPMEDYEVRDVMARSTTPDIILEPGMEHPLDAWGVLNFIAVNRSAAPAPYFVVVLYIDRDIPIQSQPLYLTEHGERRIAVKGTWFVFREFHYHWIEQHDRIPLFAGLRESVFPRDLAGRLAFERDPGGRLVIWEVRAPGRINREAVGYNAAFKNWTRYLDEDIEIPAPT